MSYRTLVELNHDYCPHGDSELLRWAKAISAYMRAADKDELPPGVTFKHYRHHSEPDPLSAWSDDMDAAPRDRQVQLFRDGEQALATWMTAIEDGSTAWVIARRLSIGDNQAVAVFFRDPTHWRLPPTDPKDAAA